MNELVKFLQDELKYWQGIAYHERQRAEKWKADALALEEEVKSLREHIESKRMM